jgi:hypothetical protein
MRLAGICRKRASAVLDASGLQGEHIFQGVESDRFDKMTIKASL